VHVSVCALKYDVFDRIVTVTVQFDSLAKLVHSACGFDVMISDWSLHSRSAVKFEFVGPSNG
jgi:hypothetical protein